MAGVERGASLSPVGASTRPATFFRETPAEGKSHIFRDNKGDFDVSESFIGRILSRFFGGCYYHYAVLNQ